jgi:hypothetical protein
MARLVWGLEGGLGDLLCLEMAPGGRSARAHVRACVWHCTSRVWEGVGSGCLRARASGLCGHCVDQAAHAFVCACVRSCARAGTGVARANNDKQFLFLNGRPVDIPKASCSAVFLCSCSMLAAVCSLRPSRWLWVAAQLAL